MKRRRLLIVVVAVVVAYGAAAWLRWVPGRAAAGEAFRDAKRAVDLRLRFGATAAEWKVENATAPAGAVVFIGSSTIVRGKWSEQFPNAVCLNRGFADENAVSLRDRLDASLPRARPGGVVLYAGSADLRMEGVSPEEAILRVDALVADLVDALPGTPIALLEILPCVGASESERTATEAVARGLARTAAAHGIAFVRTRVPPLIDASGDLPANLAVDRFHLNDAGYKALAARIRADGGALATALGAP